MVHTNKKQRVRPHLWLINFIGLIVPRRLRADWKQEWEAEFRYRELLLADWDKLNWKNKLDLLRRSHNLTGDDQSQRLEAALVSAGFFQMLGAEAALGRVLLIK